MLVINVFFLTVLPVVICVTRINIELSLIKDSHYCRYWFMWVRATDQSQPIASCWKVVLLQSPMQINNCCWCTVVENCDTFMRSWVLWAFFRQMSHRSLTILSFMCQCARSIKKYAISIIKVCKKYHSGRHVSYCVSPANSVQVGATLYAAMITQTQQPLRTCLLPSLGWYKCTQTRTRNNKMAFSPFLREGVVGRAVDGGMKGYGLTIGDRHLNKGKIVLAIFW